MTTESRSRSAQILYRPVGLVGSVAGGIVAGQVFKQVYGHLLPGPSDQAPGPLDRQYSLGQVVAGAAIQGAVFASVKAAVDRLGARGFQRWTGEWPGK